MSQQCTGITTANTRCVRKVRKGKYCIMHDPKYKKQRSHNASLAASSSNKKRYKRVREVKDPFQDLITAMVRKALVDIFTGGR